jgi:hypothetical protein
MPTKEELFKKWLEHLKFRIVSGSRFSATNKCRIMKTADLKMGRLRLRSRARNWQGIN